MKLTGSQEQIKNIKKVNSLRESLGMPLLVPTPRECLRCLTKFISYQFDIRTCYNCSHRKKEVTQ